ncbi:flagellin [Sphingomonas sp. HT-1]|uniref:flagellin N-terminal helical domain-containing protein n=1 Tax=unclassified Sphingomonas TaxID=196159 RepID=UPI0002D38C3B|nr:MULTISPECIES: flagellin [unclassified Sphingomonas]KTF69048.1 hypothetical protein ATB93_11360 [Sphingomonas sp. WG]
MMSILTNTAAAQAVRALNEATAEIDLRQQRISTGRKVNGTKDDSASYIIAQSLRGDAGSRRAIGQSMARAGSVLDVAASGAEQISDLVNQIKSKGYSLSAASDATSRAAIRAYIEALVTQINSIAKSADFNGTNLLTGKEAPLVRTSSTMSMSTSAYALPPVPTMAALPQGSTITDTSKTSYGLPASPLTPASFATALATLSGGGAKTATMNAGAAPGRVVLVIDAFSVPDAVEIWQGSTRVAATGASYTPGGAATGPGSNVSGKSLLAFDYDPAKGQDLEIRVNPAGAQPGTAWTIQGLQLQDLNDPLPSDTTYQSGSVVTSIALGDPLPVSTDPEQAGESLNMPPENASTSYSVDLGTQAGRLDVAFDAFGVGDVMEAWQNGVRLGATGQSYAPGGNAVPAGTAVTGQQIVSFDYDPTKGAVTFQFNPGGASPNSAWAVTGMALNRTTDPVATATTSSSSAQIVGYAPVNYDVITNLDQSTLRITSRDLTAAGLGLEPLDWSEPSRVVDAATAAGERMKEALSHFGSKARAFDRAASFNSTLADVLDGAVGALVDADLAVESAKLQSAQIKQQLAAKALSIANNQPKILLSLFDRAA